MLPTTIGDTRQFAVIVDLDEHIRGEWLFGKVGYVIGGTSVGDYGLGTSLRDVLLQMHLILSDAGKRHTERFVGLPKDKLFTTLWNALYGDDKSGFEEIANEECWAKHNITLPVDVFDHVRVLQFDEHSISRILWSRIADDKHSTINEIIVPTGCTERAFDQLFALLNQITTWEVSVRSP
jgi:hypothetical protein